MFLIFLVCYCFHLNGWAYHISVIKICSTYIWIAALTIKHRQLWCPRLIDSLPNSRKRVDTTLIYYNWCVWLSSVWYWSSTTQVTAGFSSSCTSPRKSVERLVYIFIPLDTIPVVFYTFVFQWPSSHTASPKALCDVYIGRFLNRKNSVSLNYLCHHL